MTLRNAPALLSAIAAVLLVAPGTSHAAERDWDWFGTTYLWGAALTADFDEDARVSDTTTEFSDVLDKTDMSLMGHLEGQGDDFGVQADLLYLGLSDGRTFDAGRVDADIATTILDVTMVWSPGDTRYEGFEAIAGVRHMSMEFEADIDPANPLLPGRKPSFDRGYTDALVGARYTLPINEKWSMGVRADTSFGDSEGSWSASFNARRVSGKRVLVLGYRFLNIEVEPREQSFDMQVHGPQIAYGWRW